MSYSDFSATEKQEPVQGITGISVRGFKSIYEECNIEVRPLTILAGANSSGKSSMMQPLLLMKQTLEASYDPGDLKLDGPHVRFTSIYQFLSNFSQKKLTNEFAIGLAISQGYSFKILFKTQPKPGLKVVKCLYKIPNDERSITLSPGMPHEILLNLIPKNMANDYEIMVDKNEEEPPRWSVSNVRCFLDFKLGEGLNFSSYFVATFQEQIRHIIHVSGLRGNPERTYSTTAVGSAFPGTFDNYVASIINYWQHKKDDKLRQLEQILERLGLTSKVETRQINDVQIQLLVGRLPHRGGAKDLVSIADVGFGISQTLPVLVALLVAEPGQLVYLEQPEIHLHPRAQVALSEILADAANRGVRIVLETHSELLLLAIQLLVAEGNFSPDLVKLHWFKRRENGVTEVSSTNVDEAGAFGDLPEDFSDVSLQLATRYLDAAAAHRKSPAL